MMRKILAGLLFVFMFFCTGCATIMSHGPQTMNIISEPDGADLEIFDRRAGSTIVKTKTPHTATLERGDGFFLKKYYDIKLTKEGYIPEKQTITPSLSGWYFANLIFGGAIGAILVDPATGCMWTYYDHKIHFKMYPDTAGGRAAKSADKKAKAEAEAKAIAEQAKMEKANNPLKYALAEASQKTSENILPDDAAETAQETSPQIRQEMPAADPQNIAEQNHADNLEKASQDINQAKGDTPKSSLDYVDTLIKGKTTKQDVERDLGKPIQEEASMNGEYVFCLYMCKQTSPEDPAGTTHKLILKFDSRGVLSDYRIKDIL